METPFPHHDAELPGGQDGAPTRPVAAWLAGRIDVAAYASVAERVACRGMVDLSEVTLPDPDAESGRGLALALASLDHLEHRRDRGRNVWVLHCTREPDPA